MHEEKEIEPRIIRLEENQDHLSKQFDSLATTVSNGFNHLEKSMAQLADNVNNRGKVSWPLVLSAIMLFISIAGFGGSFVTSYVALKTNPLEVQANHVEPMRDEIRLLQIEAAKKEVRLSYNESIMNHIWQTQNKGSPEIIPSPKH